MRETDRQTLSDREGMFSFVLANDPESREVISRRTALRAALWILAVRSPVLK